MQEPKAVLTAQLQSNTLSVLYLKIMNASLADQILALCSFTLGKELVEHGRERLKSCASTPCEEIFVDHSKNGRQRFCSKQCSTRFHVKKHRQSIR